MDSVGVGGGPCSDPDPIMPFKANAARRQGNRVKEYVTNG